MALVCLASFVNAETGDSCESDTDCDPGEFCDRIAEESDSGTCQELGNVSTSFQRMLEETSIELVSSWQSIAVMALMLSVVLVALAYMISKALDMPQLMAWAGTELGQIFANAILIIILILVIGFLDSMVLIMVNTADIGGLQCTVGEACLHKVVVSEHGYLPDMIDSAKNGAKNVLQNNMVAAAWMGRRAGINCITFYCLMAGFNMPLAPTYMLDVDMNKILFEYWTSILSSLHSQKFFVDQICFKVGPVILALGIVARTFFITRKMGGLLIAIAAGLMFVFPMMYVFDWMTLDMTITGDKAVEDAAQGCPPVCKESPPYAYYKASATAVAVKLEETKEVYEYFSDEDYEIGRNIATGDNKSAQASGSDEEGNEYTGTVYSCYHEIGGELNDSDGKEDCPTQCRELPYSYSLPDCADPETQRICAELPAECKTERVNLGARDDPEYEACPEECKMIPPMKNNCDEGRCLDSRFDCRLAKYDDPDWRPFIDHGDDLGDSGSVQECRWAADCPTGSEEQEDGSYTYNPYQSCVSVIPEYGACDDLCNGCPEICRLENADMGELPEQCFAEGYDDADPSTWEFSLACQGCPNTCKVDMEYIEELDTGNCSGCPEERRIMAPSIPDTYLEDSCSPENCPLDAHNRAEIPFSTCQGCVFTKETYTYNPPVVTDCGSLCEPSKKVPAKSPGDYTEADEDGLIGRGPIVSVSKYIIPAYLLPLFNIMATIVFIKGFSTILGGDVTIPGLKKVF